MLLKDVKSAKIRVEDVSDPSYFDENCSLRKEYHEMLSRIMDDLPKDKSKEEQARYAFNCRNRIRQIIRDKMNDTKAKEFLNLNKPNKTFEEMVEHKKIKLERLNTRYTMDDIYDDIIKTSVTPNKLFDNLFKKKE